MSVHWKDSLPACFSFMAPYSHYSPSAVCLYSHVCECNECGPHISLQPFTVCSWAAVMWTGTVWMRCICIVTPPRLRLPALSRRSWASLKVSGPSSNQPPRCILGTFVIFLFKKTVWTHRTCIDRLILKKAAAFLIIWWQWYFSIIVMLLKSLWI